MPPEPLKDAMRRMDVWWLKDSSVYKWVQNADDPNDVPYDNKVK